MLALARQLIKIPLIQDIAQQRKRLLVFSVKVLVLVLLFTSVDRMAAGFLVKGLKRTFGSDTAAELLCVGHSHTILGIDKVLLSNRLRVPVAIYARAGANAADRLVMIKHYLEEQPSSVKVIVYDVDAHAFTGTGLSVNSHMLFYPFMDSPSVNSYVRRKSTFCEYSLRQFVKLTRFDLETCNSALRGWLRIWANLKRGTIDIKRLQKEIAKGDVRQISFDKECFDFLEETLRFVSERGIHLVLLYIPTIDLYNQAQSEKYERAIRLLEDYSAKFNGVTFLNYNPAFAHRHELFNDRIHLNPQGQKLVTERLAHDLKSILLEMSDRPNEYVKDKL